MNGLNQQFDSLTIDPNEINCTNADDPADSTTTNSNQIEFNSVYTDLDVDKLQTDEDDTNQIIDDVKLIECEENDEDYLNKEHLIHLLKTYKNLLSNKQSKAKMSSLEKMQKSSYDDENSMDTDYQVNLEFTSILTNYHHNDTNSDECDDSIDDINKKLLFELKKVFTGKNMIISNELGGDEDDGADVNIENDDDLPKNLIVTSLPSELFANVDIKSKFEHMFTEIDASCKFFYFRIFKRCLIQYENPISAILARFELDDKLFLNDSLRIFLTKPIKLKNTRPFLEPPQNEKTFLISPPSSPPVGWQQELEDPPVINFDLLAALSKINPSIYFFYDLYLKIDSLSCFFYLS